MTKKELTSRWKTKEGYLLLSGVINNLERNLPLSSITGLEKHQGRWDLRGAVLSEIEKEHQIESVGHTLKIRTGSLKLKNAFLDSVDFSYASLTYSNWYKCALKNCLFEEVNAKGIRFAACDIEDCAFIKSNLSYSYLNENIGSNSGSYLKTYFKSSNLSESIFCFPLVKSCVFEDCNLYAANFDGSRLQDCEFVGEVNSPWFRGYSITANKSILGIFNRIDTRKYSNAMENVDFSKAQLLGVSFTHKIDLQRCRFPEGDNYIFIENLRHTMEKVKNIIEVKWKGEDRTKGLLLIEKIYFKKDKYEQVNDFIDTFPLASDDDLQFDNKFFGLMRDCLK